MKFVVLLALVFICKAFGGCPESSQLDCVIYESRHKDCNRKLTFFTVDGDECKGCNMCIPESTPGGECPNIPCPYKKSVFEIVLQDVGVIVHHMKMLLNGKTCNACDIAEHVFGDLSWLGLDVE